MSTYETAVAENIAIKYYLEMAVNFQWTTQVSARGPIYKISYDNLTIILR